jgi:MFS family permease
MKKQVAYSAQQQAQGQPTLEGVAASETPRAVENKGQRLFRSLRQRNFRLYWFGQMVSLVGTWMQSIGQAWLVLTLTHSPVQLGVVGALQWLPVLLFSLFGGVFADRWPKRRVLLITQTAAMLQALLLWGLVATSTVQIWHIYLLALLLGLTNCLGWPAGRAFTVELVGREDLPNAIALNASLANLARIVGPGLGGVIIALRGEAALFLLNALSFLAVIAALALINTRLLHAQPAPQGSVSGPQTIWQRLGEGIAYVWKTPAVLSVILVVALVLLFGSNFNIFLPLFATAVLHAGPSGFGFLSAAIGAGSLLAALWLAWRNQQPAMRRVLAGVLLFGVLEVGFALSPLYPLSIALIAGVGFAETTFASLATTMLQTVTPDHLRGRVMSVQVLFFDGTVPVGYLLVGWLASLAGPSIAMLICACLCLLIAGVGWRWREVVAGSVSK